MEVGQKKILFIGHDANVAGAQYVLLDLLTSLKEQGLEIHLLLVKGGKLLPAFEKIANVILWEFEEKQNRKSSYSKFVYNKVFKINKIKRRKFYNEKIQEIKALNPDLIFSNTIANGEILRNLDFLKCPFIVYVHELENSIKKYTSPEDLDFQLKNATYFLAASQEIKNYFYQQIGVSEEKITVINPFISVKNILEQINKVDKSSIKASLDIPKDALIIGGCGNFEWRKGVDIFLNIANTILQENRQVHFLWIGINKHSVDYQNILYDIEKMGIQNNVHLIPPTTENVEYMACFDIFFLASREDPHPLVMIEASLNKIPIVCFANSGGAPNYVENDERVVIPYSNIVEAQKQLNYLLEHREVCEEIGERMYQKALNYDSKIAAPKVLSIMQEITSSTTVA